MPVGDFIIQFDEVHVRQLLDELGAMPRQVPRAATVAINRTVRKGTTLVRREMARRYGIRSRALGTGERGLIRPLLANFTNLSGGIRLTNFNIPLDRFVRGEQKRRSRLGAEVHYRKREDIVRILEHRAFSNPPSLPEGRLFARSTRDRLPIHRLYGPSARKMWEGAPDIAAQVMRELDGDLQKQLASQIDRFLQRKKISRRAA